MFLYYIIIIGNSDLCVIVIYVRYIILFDLVDKFRYY